MFVVFPALAARRAASAVCLFGALSSPLLAQTPAEPQAPNAPVNPDAPVDPDVPRTLGAPASPGAVPGAAVTGAPSTTPLSAPVLNRIFATEAGMLISPIKADRVKDFEDVMARLHEALAASPDETRRKQAAGWRIFRATEPGPGASVLYVSIMSPAVPKADYTVGTILLEAFPLEEVEDLHERYSMAFAGAQMILSLRPLADFGQAWQPVSPSRK